MNNHPEINGITIKNNNGCDYDINIDNDIDNDYKLFRILYVLLKNQFSLNIMIHFFGQKDIIVIPRNFHPHDQIKLKPFVVFV